MERSRVNSRLLRRAEDQRQERRGGHSPCAVPQDVPAVEGVDGDVLGERVGVLAEDGLPAVEQDLVLQKGDNVSNQWFFTG